jgi:Flp pilus assembly protein TadD
MKPASESRARPEALSRRRILLLAAFLASAVGIPAALIAWRRAPERSRRLDLDTGSPYRNTRAGVEYVGDAACARCHTEIAETYRRHPMGRSLAPIDGTTPPPDGGATGRVLFDAQGLEYAMENRDGRLIHRETRRDRSGRVVARNEAEVRFAVGSGRQGVAYLIERDGFLFQSPITWYVRDRQWDLSPGYDTTNLHFDRTVTPDCLSCHANRVEPVAGMVNRYRRPIFRGHAIGCERCHGPGELHVRRPSVVDGRDLTIVNPAKLEPPLRDAVCQQCHLNGHRRVVRLDRRAEDFRPGLPFHRFWTVLEAATGTGADRFVGQFEQMRESRCFRASGGRLGCISCHDPHELPPAGEKAAYFRGRCLECHADRGCRLPAAARQARSRDDDCVGCHMPRARSADIFHAATTNHRIPRLADEADRSPDRAEGPPDDQSSLVIFHRDLMDDRDRAAAARDIGVAVCRDGPAGAAMAVPRLEAALASRPDDTAAWEALGFALGQLGRGEEALAAFRTALDREPDRETALTGAAFLASRGGRIDDAIAFWKRDIAISPWRSEYHAELAYLDFRARDWAAAAAACREALRLNPVNVEVRKLLVRCDLRRRDLKAAREEFQTLLGFDPPDREELIRWFTPLLR